MNIDELKRTTLPEDEETILAWIKSVGIKVGEKNEKDQTLMHLAATVGRVNAMKWLKRQGEDIRARDGIGAEPIHYAAGMGQIDVMEWLKSQGVDINTKTSLGIPMHYAASRGQVEAMDWLNTHGADITAKNDSGHTPLDVVCMMKQTEAITWLKNATGGKSTMHEEALKEKTILAWIKSQEIEVGERNKEGRTLMHFAAWLGRVEEMKWLKKQGEDIKARDTGGKEPIHYAAAAGQIDVLEWLNSQGVDINTKTSLGIPMHHAASRGQVEAMDWLNTHGADITAKNDSGHTPLDVACMMEQTEAITWLKNASGGKSTMHEEAPKPVTTPKAKVESSREVQKTKQNTGKQPANQPVSSPVNKAIGEKISKQDLCGSCLAIRRTLSNGLSVTIEEMFDNSPSVGEIVFNRAVLMCMRDGGGCPRCIDLVTAAISSEAKPQTAMGPAKLPPEPGTKKPVLRPIFAIAALVVVLLGAVYLVSSLQKNSASDPERHADTPKQQESQQTGVRSTVQQSPQDQLSTAVANRDSRQGKKVNAAGADGGRALDSAVASGDVERVRFLLTTGADGGSALCNAAYNSDVDRVKLLLAAGVDVNAKSHNDTALHSAMESMTNMRPPNDVPKHFLETVRVLLAAKPDINAKDRQGQTALHMATTDRNRYISTQPVAEARNEIIQMLLAAGANVNAKNDKGETALSCAVSLMRGAEDLGIREANRKAVKMLMAAGADIHAKDNKGFTVLMNAAAGMPVEFIKDLLAAGVDANAKADNGWTAMFFVAVAMPPASASEIIKVLLAAGADINAKADDGRTALHRAADGGYFLDNVKALLAARADANIKNANGDTAYALLKKSENMVSQMDNVRQKNHAEIARLLGEAMRLPPNTLVEDIKAPQPTKQSSNLEGIPAPVSKAKTMPAQNATKQSKQMPALAESTPDSVAQEPSSRRAALTQPPAQPFRVEGAPSPSAASKNIAEPMKASDVMLIENGLQKVMLHIVPQFRSGVRAMGYGGVATYWVLPSKEAALTLSGRSPAFLIACPGNVQLRSYVTLAHFAVRRNGTRELLVTGGAYSAAAPQDRVIATTSVKAADQSRAAEGFVIYEIKPAAPLKPGQYALMVSKVSAHTAMRAASDSYYFFDFGVK